MSDCAVCGWFKLAGCSCEAAHAVELAEGVAGTSGCYALADEELRPVTALFADIAGSTSLGERLAPHLVRLIIGDCISELTAIVERFDGSVTAHMGDGIAAFFGLHGAHEDDPRRAVFAALEMIGAVEAFAAEVAIAWDAKDFAVRIGVNAGRVATARIGAADPAKHALGDPVNIAARLQAVAPRNGILVGQKAAVQLDERFDLEQLTPLVVKGREERVSAWKLCGFNPSAKRDLSVAPLIGREVESQALEFVADDILAGRGRILLLTGDAGIGKSRLLAEFRNMVGSEGVWLEASCAGHGANTPFKPIADLVRHWAEIDHDMPPVAVRVSLRHALGESGLPDIEDVLPGFEWLLGAYVTDESLHWNDQRSPEAVQEEMRGAVSKWLRHLTGNRPVVIALEDVEKIDVSTRSMVEQVMGLTDEKGLSLVVALRPDSYSEGWGVRVKALAEYAHRTREISVPPLTDPATTELISVLDQEEYLTDKAREGVVRTAEGNPLFAEELYRSLIEGESGEDSEPNEDLPLGLEGLLLARIDRFGSTTRMVLQCAAAIGRTFSVDLIKAALGLPCVDGILRELLRSGLITEEGPYLDVQYTFRHGLFREAALSTLPPESRRELHRHIARALEAGSGRGEDLEVLADHCATGGLWNKASLYFVQAADRALQVDAVEEAVGLLERAWESGREGNDEARRLAIGRKLAALLVDLGRAREALGVYERTLGLVSGEYRAQIYAEMVECLADSGHFEEADRVLEEGRSQIGGGRVSVHLQYASAHLAFRENRFVEVPKILRAIELEDEGRSVLGELQAKFAWLWGGVSAVDGDFASAELWTRERRYVGAQLRDAVCVLEADMDLAVLSLCQGRVVQSRGILEGVLREAGRLGYRKQMCGAALNLLHVYWLSGRLREGLRLVSEIESWSSIPIWRQQIVGACGWMCLIAGDSAKAKMLYKSALYGGGRSVDQLVVSGCHLGLAMVAWTEGDRDRGERELGRVVGELEAAEVRLEHRSWARVGLAEIAIARRDGVGAEHQAKLALADAERAERPARVAPLRVLGTARELQGRGSGREDLEYALALAREMGMRLEEGRALAALARFGLGAGEDLLDRAREIFEECGAYPDLKGLEEHGRATGAGAI